MGWFLLIVAVLVVLTVVGRRQKKSEDEAAIIGKIRHLVSGEFPAHCSWCKNTSLAKAMTVLELQSKAWKVLDLDQLAARLPDTQVVETYTFLYEQNVPSVRRLCSEVCVVGFLDAKEGKALKEQLRSCAFCQTEFLQERHKCPNCGASNSGSSSANPTTTSLPSAEAR